jgi:hypothetical protein
MFGRSKYPNEYGPFLWLAARDRLMTNGNATGLGVASDSRCGGCNGSLEDAVHVLRDCPHAMAFWQGNKWHFSRRSVENG